MSKLRGEPEMPLVSTCSQVEEEEFPQPEIPKYAEKQFINTKVVPVMQEAFPGGGPRISVKYLFNTEEVVRYRVNWWDETMSRISFSQWVKVIVGEDDSVAIKESK